jgi:hypothetical protein
MEIWKTSNRAFETSIFYCKVNYANCISVLQWYKKFQKFLRFWVDESWGASKPEFL